MLDEEVLNRARSKIVEQSALYPLSELLSKKQDIMNAVRNDVLPYFKDRGVTITSLGMAGELTYLNPEIQAAINKKFQAAQDLEAQKFINQQNLETQRATNERVLSKAKADAQAAQILNNPNALTLKRFEMQSKFLEKWDGALPKVSGGSGSMINIDSLMRGESG